MHQIYEEGMSSNYFNNFIFTAPILLICMFLALGCFGHVYVYVLVFGERVLIPDFTC